MDWDEPKARKTFAIGENLSTLSVGELEDRIAALAAEIDRVKAEVDAKKKHSAAAASIFKS